jgi:hypothetical protein
MRGGHGNEERRARAFERLLADLRAGGIVDQELFDLRALAPAARRGG